MRRSLWSSCISFSFSLLSLALQHQFSSHRITEDKLQRTNNIHHTCISTILLRHSSSKGFCHCPEQCVLHPPWCSTNSVTALKALNDIYPLSSHWTASLPISTEALSPRPNAHMTDITSKQQSWSFEGICVPFCLTNCLFLFPTLNLWRPSFSSCRCMDLERSSTAYHICSVTSRLLLSLKTCFFELCYP